MGRVFASLRRRIFGISQDEVSFAKRGFPGRESPARPRLEYVAGKFLDGYHQALAADGPNDLARRLATIDLEVRGFAFEGAAMALALLDTLTPWNRWRVRSFLRGPGDAHAYMVHVGVGWALARLHRPVAPTLKRFDLLLRWLIVDGYGFHETFFHWRRCVQEQTVPDVLGGYERRMFDQGLGRCLWFVEGAEVESIARAITGFPPGRQVDLWSGVGLACAYAGGVERKQIELLRGAAGEMLPQLAQGAAFGAKARQRAGNLAPHTETACRVLCGMSADTAAGITDAALKGLTHDGPEPAFDVWRRRIQEAFGVAEGTTNPTRERGLGSTAETPSLALRAGSVSLRSDTSEELP